MSALLAILQEDADLTINIGEQAVLEVLEELEELEELMALKVVPLEEQVAFTAMASLTEGERLAVALLSDTLAITDPMVKVAEVVYTVVHHQVAASLMLEMTSMMLQLMLKDLTRRTIAEVVEPRESSVISKKMRARLAGVLEEVSQKDQKQERKVMIRKQLHLEARKNCM